MIKIKSEEYMAHLGAGRSLGASSGVLGVRPNILLDTNTDSLLLNNVVISKELRDLLQRLARGFRHEEEREDGGKDAENSEEQVSSPADLNDHLRDDNANDEVCKPDHSSSSTDALSSL